MRGRLGWGVAWLWLLCGNALAGEQALIYAGTLLARPGSPAESNVTVAIVDGRVAAVVPGFPEAAELTGVFDLATPVERIDLREHFVMPGLMDAHVHITAQPSLFVNNARNGGGEIGAADFALNAAVYAQRTLAAGFTTIRDVGSDTESVFALRTAINQGLLPGPTLLASGPIISATGGHGDKGFGQSDSLQPQVRRRQGVCDGADECQRAVRHNIGLGADLIKFTASGGFMSGTGTQQQYELSEMQAIVATAHQRNLKVAAHVYSAEAAELALKAGVDSLEHGWLLDAAALRQMRKQGVYLVPTLLISRPSAWANMAGTAKGGAQRDRFKAFEQAYAMGVKIAFGTDVGVFDHGQNALEFDVMVELGMSPADALRSATVTTAELFGLEDELGTLEVGKRADVIALTRNPLADITALHAVDFVMKSGRVVKHDGIYTGGIVSRPVAAPVSFR